MNRIRKYKNKYQVLITPYHSFDPGFELMLGSWSDDQLRNYSIKEFSSMEDAMAESFDHPDINWEKMVIFHKDIYANLYKIIKSELEEHAFIVEFEPKIMTPHQVKNIMFDRVMKMGKRFRLDYNLNDVIGFHIINPWGKNLRDIYGILKNNSNLRIARHEYEFGIIRMIGVTSIGSNYEIVLWPTLVSQWAKWSAKHPELSEQAKDQSLKDILVAQQNVEKCVNIR